MEYTAITRADKDLCEQSRLCALRLDHDGVREATIELLERRFIHGNTAVRKRAKATVKHLRAQMGEPQ